MHKNARLTPKGRELLLVRLQAGQLVSFMRYDLGFFDHETYRIESAENPFAAKVSPMSPARMNCYLRLRNRHCCAFGHINCRVFRAHR